MKTLIVLVLALSLSACGKVGVTGHLEQAVGNWAEYDLPKGCVVKQIAASGAAGVAILCEDGRVFH